MNGFSILIYVRFQLSDERTFGSDHISYQGLQSRLSGKHLSANEMSIQRLVKNDLLTQLNFCLCCSVRENVYFCRRYYDMVMNQEILLKLLGDNDDKAYRQLYHHYYVALKSFACGYVGNEDVAKDLVQDVFVAMLGCEKKFLNLNEVKLYLYTAVKNRAFSYLRNQKVQDRYIGEILQEGDEAALFWDRVLEEDVYALLMMAVDTLPCQCRKVMLLTLEGCKPGEIAAEMNISVETVKDHKSSGKKKLAELLKEGSFLCLLDFLFI